MMWFALGVGLLAFLFFQGMMDPTYQIIFLGVLFLFGIVLSGTGKGRTVKRVRKRSAVAALDAEAAMELPAPVLEEEDASTRRQQKMSRSRGGDPSGDEDEEEDEDEEITVTLAEDEVEVGVIEENVHVAESFVAEVDAESIEEATIEDYVDEKRDHHAKIRRKIEARRREQLAEIRAGTARQYQGAETGEDLLGLLTAGDHGLTIINEPETTEPGHPYGATFVRIDESRVLKVRVALDEGYVASVERKNALPPPLGDLPLPDDLPLLDLPLPEGMALPPPPSVGQDKLAAMRDELSE